MEFMRQNWYRVGIVLFIVLSFFMLFVGYRIFSEMQIILLAAFMAMLAHQFEEYILPGGLPYIFNHVIYGEQKDYDRYPQNAQSCLLVNMICWVIYITAFLCPQYIWMGMAAMIFGVVGQVLTHGIFVNIKNRSFYNPGLLTALFLFVPVAIYYFYYVYSNHLIKNSDYVYAVLYFLFLQAAAFSPIRLVRQDRNSPYVFKDMRQNH